MWRATSRRAFKIAGMGPSTLFLSLLFIGPFAYMLWLSVTDLNLAQADQEGRFLGLENYLAAFSRDGLFWASVRRSAIYTLLCVGPQMVFGVVAAEWLSKRRALRRTITPFLALPMLLPAVVVGLLWRLLLQGEFGLASFCLRELGWSRGGALLSDVDSILVTLAVIDFWQWVPFVVLVLLAVRLSLPSAPIEAAVMDGARGSQVFRDVVLPGMLPTVGVVAVIRAINSFKEFDKVFILTGGGPGSGSEMGSLYIWRVVFRRWDFGYGAALCTLFYFAVFVGIQILGRLRRKVVMDR